MLGVAFKIFFGTPINNIYIYIEYNDVDECLMELLYYAAIALFGIIRLCWVLPSWYCLFPLLISMLYWFGVTFIRFFGTPVHIAMLNTLLLKHHIDRVLENDLISVYCSFGTIYFHGTVARLSARLEISAAVGSSSVACKVTRGFILVIINLLRYNTIPLYVVLSFNYHFLYYYLAFG